MISKGALQHRQFRIFLEENEAFISELPKLHSVRWLSCEKVFNAFFCISDLINQFVENKFGPELFPELSDKCWLQKLAFFSDLTSHLGTLNRSLQGSNNTVWESYRKIAEFKMALENFKDDIKCDNYEYFQNLDKLKKCGDEINSDIFSEWIGQLKVDFERRFSDFESIVPLMKFAKSPTSVTLNDIDIIAEKLGVNKTELKNDTNKYKSELLLVEDPDLSILKRFKTLKVTYAKIFSIFSSSYACESAFSRLNYIYNNFRSSMTQQNVENCLQIATSNIELNLEKIVSEMKCRIEE